MCADYSPSLKRTPRCCSRSLRLVTLVLSESLPNFFTLSHIDPLVEGTVGVLADENVDPGRNSALRAAEIDVQRQHLDLTSSTSTTRTPSGSPEVTRIVNTYVTHATTPENSSHYCLRRQPYTHQEKLQLSEAVRLELSVSLLFSLQRRRPRSCQPSAAALTSASIERINSLILPVKSASGPSGARPMYGSS